MTAIPVALREDDTAVAASALFRRAFGADPPTFPRHFLALRGGDVVGYVHYTAFEPGVYLCGGLCVDQRVYRALSPAQREALAARGSLSRWLLEASIAALGAKRAVFAYTGDTRSRRDVLALGFVPAAGRYLLAQWHEEAMAARATLVRRIEAQGPF